MKTSYIIRSFATSWVAGLASAIVGFFLTPYVLHHLGDTEFGLWTLVTTLTGYYGFLDLGVRSAILRFVSRSRALDNQDEINRVICTAFYFYLSVCLVAFAVTGLVFPWLPQTFGVHGETAHAFGRLFLLMGVLQGISLPLNVFAGSVNAAGRFDLAYVVETLGLGVRVVLVITAVRAGGGLFAVGAAMLFANLFCDLLQIPLALWLIRGLSLRPKWVSKASLREMFRYASVTFGVGVGDMLKANISPVLVGLFMNPAAVTFFSLPARLLRFPVDGTAVMTGIVNPASSHLEAREDFTSLRRLIRLSVQSAFLILAPMSAILFIYGRELLRLWVGEAYVSAFPLLVLLTLGLGCGATQACVQSMLFGIGRHKGLIAYRLGEAGAITLIGGVMLKMYGLEAFALVIAITLMITSLVLVPRHLCRMLGLPLGSYLKDGFLKPVLLTLPFAATLYALHSWTVVRSWFGLVGVLAAGGVVHLATLAWAAFRPGKKSENQWTSLGVLEIVAERLRPILL
ncbi:MAG TPA: oligosaccharide flippase family protein [Candidatus Acidoferrum sp.]|nr:oligosaccharide flippase family protein [Candidatus Acidoferrum sp.]